MITFKQFLLQEGGNVQIDDQEAERIDLKKYDRTKVVKKVGTALAAINAGFKKQVGKPIWSDSLMKSKKYLSGSAFHFFNDQIDDKTFVKYKNSVGDIDTQVDKNMDADLKDFLTKNKGKDFGPVKLIGFKTSAGQHITLWHLDEPAINIQIDLEMVDFDEKGDPTEWSNFSHSSSWDDMTKGIKGVAQKMLLRALMAPKLRDVLIAPKTARGSEKETQSATHAFSVTHGVRQKLDPVLDASGKQVQKNGKPVYRELSTAESKGETNLIKMFSYFFDKAPSSADLKKFESFVGLISLIRTHIQKKDWVKICDGFVNTLWGSIAQGLYRGDPQKDNEEKTMMVQELCQSLDVDPKKYDTIKSTYYKSYK
jgi:hypothetical protein